METRFKCVYEAKCADFTIDKILLCSDGGNLTRLEFMESRGDLSVESRRDSIMESYSFCESRDSHTGNLNDSSIESRFESHLKSVESPIFAESKKWLDLYFSGEIPQFTPRFAFPSNASAFSLRVWEILQRVPYGKTSTYGAIAKQIAREFGIAKMSAQAIGGALSRNPIAIIIPCHRVVGANNIGGYNGGIANKLALLKIEGIATNRLKIPKI